MRSRKGLTIVEVMLAIAITAMLAAILLPLFSHSRELSMRTRCASNLRQLAAGFYLYSQDWGNYWPCPGGLSGDRAYWAQTGSGGLQSYVKQRGVNSVWCCPRTTEWHNGYPARTYCMNSYLRTPADIEYPTCVSIVKGISINAVTLPRETILLYEGVKLTNGYEGTSLYNYIYRCANWSYVRGYYDKVAYAVDSGRPAHGGRNNYLYCDGHIVARPPGRRIEPTFSTYKEMHEWYVDKNTYERVYQQYWARLVPRE